MRKLDFHGGYILIAAIIGVKIKKNKYLFSLGWNFTFFFKLYAKINLPNEYLFSF